jgi:serine/threonine-protein kinase
VDWLAQLGEALRGRYVVERQLARGGMAVLALGHVEGTGAPVAIKVLRPEFARAVGPERFGREIEILRRLAHPRIVPLLDSGLAATMPFLVMPYLTGPTLRDLIARTPAFPLDEVVNLARDVGGALDYAHAMGVVHRDIKPENVLLSEGHAVLMDFGIARAVEVAGAETLSSSGLMLGTPAYMSPEQAESSSRADARSDLYALGCVLYEMLTGEPPFTGADARAVLARHAADHPRSIRVVRPELPDHAERAVLAALAKRPQDRPPSGAALAAQLAGLE